MRRYHTYPQHRAPRSSIRRELYADRSELYAKGALCGSTVHDRTSVLSVPLEDFNVFK